MLSLGGPLWGAAVALMLVVLIVLTAVRLKRTADGPVPLVATAVVVALVLGGIGLLLATGRV